jgi:hypothetical protein
MNAAKRASGQVVDKKTGEIIQEGRPVYGVYTNMGGESNDYSTMVSDTVSGNDAKLKDDQRSPSKNLTILWPIRIEGWPGMEDVQNSQSKLEEVRSTS